MKIAGGTYRELCMVPHWDQCMGSGLRAALILSQRTSCSLHTYCAKALRPVLGSLDSARLIVEASPRASDIAFSYLHPASRPHTAPDTIVKEPALNVESEAVLRFGFLEGDAVISAKRAVYDPQMDRGAGSFFDNGSWANDVALVANEEEVKSHAAAGGNRGLERLFEVGYSIVVVKRGPRGATLYFSPEKSVFVPAYYSSRVFKIGSGDVFSALFAFHWAELGADAVDAAHLASQATAAYCEEPHVFELDRSPRRKAGGVQVRPLAVIGSPQTLTGRWLLEETRFRLQEMGMDTEIGSIEHLEHGQAVLVLAQELDNTVAQRLAKTLGCLRSTVFVQHAAAANWWQDTRLTQEITADFTTALYFGAWSACTLANDCTK